MYTNAIYFGLLFENSQEMEEGPPERQDHDVLRKFTLYETKAVLLEYLSFKIVCNGSHPTAVLLDWYQSHEDAIQID